jgi:Ca2+-binding EF-hand superfamily protein
MPDKYTVLVISNDRVRFTQKIRHSHPWKEVVSQDHSVKHTGHEWFMEGERIDKFDMVICNMPTEDNDDMEMQIDCYKHYLIAPVCYFLSPHDKDDLSHIKDIGDHINFVKYEEDDIPIDKMSQEITDAFNAGKAKYEEILDKEVKPAFSKFDKDNSGAIDKDELAKLSKDLGTELTEE